MLLDYTNGEDALETLAYEEACEIASPNDFDFEEILAKCLYRLEAQLELFEE